MNLKRGRVRVRVREFISERIVSFSNRPLETVQLQYGYLIPEIMEFNNRISVVLGNLPCLFVQCGLLTSIKLQV